MALTEKTVSWLCSYSIMVCAISAFDVQCPHSSQRQILAKVFCNGSEISKYSCLYDINNHVYTESCNRLPDFVRPGKRYVFMGSRTGIDCSSERYQPFKFWSNELSDCVYQKSLCNEIGQHTYQNHSTKEDNTCSCDYTKGYDFVTQPKHIQYCIPSKEDCSCYLVQCADNNTLSSDYKCRPGLKQKNENNSTENTDTRDIKPSFSDEDDGMVVGGRCIITITKLIICYIVLTVIASIIVITIDYCLPNKWCRTDNKRQEMPPLRDRIISNFSSLIPDLDSKTVFLDLLKLNLVTEQEVKEEQNNQPNTQNRFILIKLIENCGELDKAIESILYKKKSIHQILQRPISARRWPKRDEAECRVKLMSAQKLLQDLQPEIIIDFFFENFIFNLKQYKKCIEKEHPRNYMIKCFLKKADKTLSKGSFECLLMALQKKKLNDMLVELEDDLIKGISFKLTKDSHLCHDEGISFKLAKDSHLCHDEVKPNIPTTVHFMISADGHDNLMEIIPADTIHECSKWFIKELAMYPVTVTKKHIVLVPLVDNIKDRIKNSIKKESFNNLLERLFCKKDVISSFPIHINTVKVTLQWGCSPGGEYSGKLEEMQLSEIFKYNQSFLESDIQPETIYQAFQQKKITLCKDEKKKDSTAIICSIRDNNYYGEFLNILKEGNCSFTLARLPRGDEDPYILRENIMRNISQLLALCSDLDAIEDIFAKNNILTKDFFENNEKKFSDNLELQKTLVLVKIIQSGTHAMFLYINTYVRRGNVTLADKLMSREAQDNIHYTDNFDDMNHQPEDLYIQYDVTMEEIEK